MLIFLLHKSLRTGMMIWISSREEETVDCYYQDWSYRKLGRQFWGFTSIAKIIQRHREESWDDEDDDDDDENSEFGLFAEEDRTVTVKSRRAALARLSASGHLPHSPTSSIFSVPTTIHTYSSTAHLRPNRSMSSLAQICHSISTSERYSPSNSFATRER